MQCRLHHSADRSHIALLSRGPVYVKGFLFLLFILPNFPPAADLVPSHLAHVFSRASRCLLDIVGYSGH